MAKIDLSSQKPVLKEDDLACGDISGIIGMISPQVKGSLAITFDQQLASCIMQNMLGETYTDICDEIIDMVGEITNMVCAGAKNELADQNYQFDMATPVIVSGNQHLIQHKIDAPKILLGFSSDKGNAYLEICFKN